MRDTSKTIRVAPMTTFGGASLSLTCPQQLFQAMLARHAEPQRQHQSTVANSNRVPEHDRAA